MMHMSASGVRVPSLPSVANVFVSGVQSIQKDFVGLGTGRFAGGCKVGCLRIFRAASSRSKGLDNADIVRYSNQVSKHRLESTWLSSTGQVTHYISTELAVPSAYCAIIQCPWLIMSLVQTTLPRKSRFYSPLPKPMTFQASLLSVVIAGVVVSAQTPAYQSPLLLQRMYPKFAPELAFR